MIALAYMAVVFKLWMLFDATRRRVHALWYLALLVPLGDVVYFFAVKLRDFNVYPARPAASLQLLEVEREAEQSPSFRNRVRAAWALLEQERPEHAQRYFELALGSHPDDKEACFGLGLCQLGQGQWAATAATLGPLVERSLAFQDYEAALALAEAAFRDRRAAASYALLQRVIDDSHRLEHRLLLARYQLRAGARSEALATLQTALHAFEAKPELERRREGAIATQARSLLRTLEQQPG